VCCQNIARPRTIRSVTPHSPRLTGNYIRTRSLKILLIDTDEERARALEERLSGFARIARATDANMAAAVEAQKPDLVIIDISLPDRDALEDIRAIATAQPVVMFAGTDDPAFAQEAIAAGVCSYNLSGLSYADIKPIMASAIALFQRYRHVETELAAARALLDERRLVERAKAILMKDRKMTEPEAYRWLQKKAMNESRKLSLIVAEFVAAHESEPRESKR
jgi:response regulator NasT